MLGLVVMYAIGPQRAYVLNLASGTNFGDTYFFAKQAISLMLALAAFFVVAKIPYRYFQKYASRLFVIAIVACVVLALAGLAHLGIAQCSNGACRWFDLGPLGSIQPAEFLKFAILIFTAGLLSARYRDGKLNDRDMTLIPVAVIALIAIVFVIGIQKDMGTGISLIAMLAAMLHAAGLNQRIGLLLLGGVLAIGFLLIISAPHRMERIVAFFAGDETSTQDPEGYHITHAKIALGTGGLLGVGIGNSVQSTGYLPEAINDSVFAIMGEIFGFVGVTAIIWMFWSLIRRILHTADRLPNMTMRLMAVGVFGWLASHVLLNIAAMTGIIPLTGITLPLLSFGGTSMVFIAGGLGLVFQLSQYTVNSNEVEGSSDADTRSRGRIRGARLSGRRSA